MWVGLPRPDVGRCLRKLEALASETADEAPAIVRLELRNDAGGGLRFLGSRRPLDESPRAWSAVTAPFPHRGPSPRSAAKTTARAVFARAAAWADTQGADEALLLDDNGRLVEGARTSVFVAATGALVTPPLARGAVAGIARALALERISGAREADVDAAALTAAREIVVVNAVRVRPVVRLDGRPVGDGRPGPWFERLSRAIERE